MTETDPLLDRAAIQAIGSAIAWCAGGWLLTYT